MIDEELTSQQLMVRVCRSVTILSAKQFKQLTAFLNEASIDELESYQEIRKMVYADLEDPKHRNRFPSTTQSRAELEV